MTRIPDDHLAAWRALLATQAHLVADIEERLSSAGLPPLAWYDVLLPLHEAKRPLRMGELAREVLTIGRTGLTRLVDRLEAAGMIRREHSVTDRRGVEVSITKEGAALLRKMWPVYAGVLESRFVGALDQAQARRLRELLDRVGASRQAGDSPSRSTAGSGPPRGG